MVGWSGQFVEGGNPFVEAFAIPDGHASIAEKCVDQHLMSCAVAIVAQIAAEQLLRGVIEVIADPFEHPLMKPSIGSLHRWPRRNVHRLCFGIERVNSVATDSGRQEFVDWHCMPFMSLA